MSMISPRPPRGQKPQRNVHSAAMRKASRGQECKLRIPGVCSHDPSKTVGCHIRAFGIAGIAQKPHDLFLVDGCSACHEILDDRSKWAAAAFGWECLLRALIETQQSRIDQGHLKWGAK